MSKQTDLLDLEKCIVSRLWYTATTIVRHQTKTTIDKNLTDLIRSCADQGIDEHRWIAYNLLLQLDNNEEAKKIVAQEEFDTTLRSLDFRIPHHIKEELLKLFASVRAAEEKNDVSAWKLSRESLECLETNLLENPATLHWIIGRLLCIWLPTRFAQSDSALQDVYFRSIRKLFGFDPETAENEGTLSSSLQKNCDNLNKKNLGVLLSILSKINLTEFKEDEFTNWIYPVLHDCCNSDDIELALYSRKNPKFFKTWHEFIDDKYARCHAADNLENAMKISKVLFDTDDDSNTRLNADEMFKRTLRRQSHWLMDIFDVCCVLLINEHHEEVEKILNNPLLEDFWLLLLFKLLNDCSTEPIYSPETWQKSAAICTALRFVLKKSETIIGEDPTLVCLKSTLNNHFNVLEWILERKKSSSLVNGSTSTVTYQNFTVKQVLQLLHNHSILAVLKMTTDIHENNYDDISALLNDTEDSRSTFQAYRAMLSALKAMFLCEFYNSTYRDVAERFDDMEKSLGDLFPLDLRLEVIENIFSMLFVRYENFVEADSGSDGGDENSAEKFETTKKRTKSEAGFLCNKYAARETLHRLKRSVTAVKLEREEEKKNWKKNDGLETGIATISKAIADAAWRLELLTSSDFIERLGNPDAENRGISTDDETILPDDRLDRSNSKIKTIFYKPNESSSDESEFVKSDLDGSSEAGSQGNSTNNSGKRRKKLRKRSSLSERSTVAKDSNKRESTLNRMLSSKESLVLQCLWKSDYDRALEVIEVFGLKNSRLEGEILFSKAMKVFRKDFRTQWDNTDVVDSPEVASKQSMLENIRRVVQDGFHTSRSTSQIETFLAAQDSCVRLLNSDATTANEILTMASLDLALTMPRTHQDSLNLSGVAMKYLQSSKKLSNTRCYDFFETIYRSLRENNSELSVQQILCDARIPLSVKKAKEKMEYWSRLSEKLEILRRMRNENDFDDLSNENSMNAEEDNFLEIMQICDNGEVYLPRLHAHLEILRTIIPAEASDTNRPDFCLLKTSLDTYIGNQIFGLNAKLEEVESVASRLRINLVHSILVNCCPKLVLHTENRCITTDKWGSTVLNKITEDSAEFNNIEPNQCVKEILSELSKALRVACFPKSTLAPSELKELSNNDEVRKILSKTQKIAKLDLSNLSFGNHTLAFFLNICNLMMLHAMLVVWSSDPPMNDLRHEMSLATVGYEIGDLGTVSLQALRSKLLGPSSWVAQFFSNTEELNEPAWQDLDVPNDPRVVFAIINEFNDSPIVRIYDLQTLNEDLNSAVVDYLNHYNGKSDRDDVVPLPELINRYNDLMSKKTNSVVDSNIAKSTSKASYKSLSYTYDVRFAYARSEKSQNIEVSTATEAPEFPWQSRIVEPNLLQYLEGHCWLVSYLVQRIHEESPTIMDSSCENTKRTAALENLLKSTWANDLKSLYDENQTVAGLRKITLSNDLWNYFQSLLTSGETEKCLNVINALPDSLLMGNAEIQRFRDVVLTHLVTNSRNLSVSEILRYVYQIRDGQVLVRLILSSSNDLPVKVCREILSHVLTHVNRETLPHHCKSRVNEISCRVAVFQKMLPYCVKPNNDDDCWHDLVHRTEKTNPVKIVRSLIDANQFELCLEWLEYQAASTEIHSLITEDLLAGLLNNDDQDFKHATKLLRALPVKKSLSLCTGVIGKLEAMGPMRFVVGYLLENSPASEIERHRRGLVGIDVLELLDVKERRSYVHLIEHPLFMLEQLLMNYRLESLQRILVGIREKYCEDRYSEKFDETVRFYATKSLDFRVAVQGELERIKDHSVSNSKAQSGDFVMPIKIPTKDEWVPNDKARECSCCGVVIFTMFNRRHHCRRCGRVVCATCSPQRMRLPSYPNSVPVRVCNDCKRQMVLQLQAATGAPSTPSSEAFECWRLTVDELHNKTLRDEFSFENAPNISLCLAILNLHSDNEAYSNFLLDRCDDMKALLRPDSKGRVNREVDHALIIKMIRSLLIAAKVKYAELGLNTGLTYCDRFLSQVDLIATLVNSDCSSLIPRTDEDDHLNDHTLSRLRDLLTEKEQWIIALDVSTKTGLDPQGVWAAWGTACLKAGYYERAREKFVRCLDKVLREDSDGWVMLSHPGESTGDRNKRPSDPRDTDHAENSRKSGNSKSHEGLKNRPSKDPPLLTEILQILDKMNPNDWYVQQNSKSTTNSAQEILNTLNSLKSISQGQCTIVQGNNAAKNFRYHESLYYLLMYGSFNSILEFFVKHGEYDKCLAYILENDVEPELFTNVYLRCLKNGCVGNFCEAMRTRDSSLVIFKKYLMHSCHSLEKKKLFNTLHQLQLFMKDYVRAAMTCIRFYVNDASTYGDLCSRTHFLTEAQKHLESELQLESFGKRRRKSVSSAEGGQYSLTLEMDTAEIDRHMNTISRQMEIAKFLGNREQEGRSVSDFMNKLSYMENEGPSSKAVPTLFGNQQEKTHLAVLAILCGRDVEEGFGIAFRIMQDYNLRQQKIYSFVGHMLALERKTNSIEQLIKCCRSSGAPNSNAISDLVLVHCVKLLLDRSRTDSDPSPKDQVDSLIRIITDVELKIDSYIESRQLKAAYLLAVKHSRAQDIRKILKEADRLGQLAIKSICTKWLRQTQGA